MCCNHRIKRFEINVFNLKSKFFCCDGLSVGCKDISLVTEAACLFPLTIGPVLYCETEDILPGPRYCSLCKSSISFSVICAFGAFFSRSFFGFEQQQYLIQQASKELKGRKLPNFKVDLSNL